MQAPPLLGVNLQPASFNINDAKEMTTTTPQKNTNPLHIIAAITHPRILLGIFVVAILTFRASRNTEATTNRLLQQNRMDSSDAEDSPQEFGNHGSLPLYILFWIACLSFTCCVFRCFANYSRRREVLFRQGHNGERLPRATLVVVDKTITDVERRKTLTLCFQRNQVTMVRICAWHFRMECRPGY
jgi:hypothetical protein